MRIVIAAAVAAAAGVLASPARAQEPADVEGIVTAAMDAHGIPGAAVAVTSGGGVETYGLGLADIDSGTPVDPAATRFPLDSISKTYTATAIMTLVSDGTLDLDADVNDYLDRVEVPDTYPGRPITLRHLLTHTAGFEETIVGLYGPIGAGDRLEDALLTGLPDRVRPPGEVSAYSNAGLALAGLTAADALDIDFDELLAQRVFEPLGLGHTAVHDGTGRDLATTYALEGGEPTAYDRPAEALYPAGGITGTAADMGAYMAYHLGDGAPLLAPDAFAELHGPQFHADPRLPGSALGFYEMFHGSTRMIAHGGDGLGSHSLMTLVPDHGLGIYIGFNGDGDDAAAAHAAEAATREILDLVLGEAVGPDGPAGVPAPETAAEAAAGTYRSTRMNESDYTHLLLAIGSDATVAVAEDGTLTTTGLSFDPAVDEQHWEPQGDGLYREAGGTRLIAFGGNPDADGGTMLLTGDGAYERVAWYERTDVLLAAGAAGLLLLASLLAWPAASLVRRLRKRPAPRPGSRTAVAFAAAAGVLSAAFLAIMTAFLADTDAFVMAVLEGTPLVPLAAIALLAAALATVGALVTGVLAWARRWWSTARRVHYTLAVLGAALFIAATEYFHLATAPLHLL